MSYMYCKGQTAEHGDLSGKLGKFVQYEINDFCLCRPGFNVPDISDSSRIVHKFVQVIHVPATGRLVGRSNRKRTITLESSGKYIL